MSRRVDMTSFLCSLCGTSQIEMPVLNFRSCFLGKFYLKSFTYQYPHLLNQLINTQSWILSWAGSLMSKLIVLQTKYPVLMISVPWSILVVHLSPELLLSGALTCLPLDQLSPFHLPGEERELQPGGSVWALGALGLGLGEPCPPSGR